MQNTIDVKKISELDATTSVSNSDKIVLNSGADTKQITVENLKTSLVMTGATASADGTPGTIPAPTTANVNHFFRGDGTWVKAGGSGGIERKDFIIQPSDLVADTTRSGFAYKYEISWTGTTPQSYLDGEFEYSDGDAYYDLYELVSDNDTVTVYFINMIPKDIAAIIYMSVAEVSNPAVLSDYVRKDDVNDTLMQYMDYPTTGSLVVGNSGNASYPYSAEITWVGIVDTDWVNVEITNGSITGVWGIEPDTDKITLYFENSPASTVTFRIFKQSTVAYSA